MCAGTSEIYIYFKHIDKMIQFGPYGPNHATAGTFAFRRELLKNNSYNDEAALAEEKSFLKNYTVPFVQLEPKKTILVFSHIHNTFDKKTLLNNPHPQFVKETDKIVDDFIKEPELKDFFMNKIEDLLINYEPGKPEMKPDVLKQIKEISKEREKVQQQMMQQQMMQKSGKGTNDGEIMADINGQRVALSKEQIVSILRQQNEKIQELITLLEKRDERIKELENQNEIKIEN